MAETVPNNHEQIADYARQWNQRLYAQIEALRAERDAAVEAGC